MKKYYLLLIVIITSLISCNDLFEKTNLESIGSDVVWDDPALLTSYVNNLYALYPTWTRQENDLSDEARNGYRRHDAWLFTTGEWGLEYNPMEYWAYSYVRKANEILFNIDDVMSLEESDKNRIKGEVKFLRATAYFNMLKRYGGVPIITEPQTLDSEDLYPERASIDETFEFIIREYDQAATLLLDFKTHNNLNFGRVTWGACKAMEARAYLFWASPLYNSSTDDARWRRSAELSKEVIESGLYELIPDPRNLFLDKESSENIFAIYYKMPERYHGVDAWCKPLSIANSDAAHWGPLQEFVDAFPTINGLSIDEDPIYDPLNPYENRDPRLNSFVCVNESQYAGRTQYNYWGLGNVDASFPKSEADRFKTYQEGGEFQDAPSTAHNSITGYINRKMVDESLPRDAYSGGWGSTTPFIEIRLGEVILNYAEALNELGEIDKSVIEVEKIRSRAGLLNPAVPSADKTSKENLRKFIQNERYIELSFEHKRYWDLRRWKLAESKLGGKRFSGIKIYLNLHENSAVLSSDAYKNATFEDQLDMLNKSWTYEPYYVDQEPYVFDKKMYFMPIPRNDMETNPNLIQNEGW